MIIIQVIIQPLAYWTVHIACLVNIQERMVFVALLIVCYYTARFVYFFYTLMFFTIGFDHGFLTKEWVVTVSVL